MPRQLPPLPPGKKHAIEMWSLHSSVFEGREYLASAGLEAIASWSYVEAAQLWAFVTLFGGRKSLSAAVFAELRGAKEDAIQVAVKARFGDKSDEGRVHLALKKASRSSELERDKLAHWMWGYCNALPDHLLLIDPKDVTFKGQMMSNAALAYSADDFKKLVETNRRLADMWGHFKTLVDIVEPTPKRASLLERLLLAPELSGTLSR